MISTMTWAPIQYLFFQDEQPSANAWKTIESFAHEWNIDHKNQFVLGESEEWNLVLANGIKDEEYPILNAALHAVKKKIAIIWFAGYADKRKPSEFELAPFIEVLGHGYPYEFVVNRASLSGEPVPCRECGYVDEEAGPFAEKPVVDESFLDGPDLINIPNGGLLISQKLAAYLEANGINGYQLETVINVATGKDSAKLFLLQAKKSILRPCNVHTPVTEEGICSTCGRIRGGLLNYFFVRKEWIEPDQVISRHALRYSDIHFSHELFHRLKEAGMKGMRAIDGIFECSHLKS